MVLRLSGAVKSMLLLIDAGLIGEPDEKALPEQSPS
jgi:hypothetical protein